MRRVYVVSGARADDLIAFGDRSRSPWRVEIAKYALASSSPAAVVKLNGERLLITERSVAAVDCERTALALLGKMQSAPAAARGTARIEGIEFQVAGMAGAPVKIRVGSYRDATVIDVESAAGEDEAIASEIVRTAVAGLRLEEIEVHAESFKVSAGSIQHAALKYARLV